MWSGKRGSGPGSEAKGRCCINCIGCPDRHSRSCYFWFYCATITIRRPSAAEGGDRKSDCVSSVNRPNRKDIERRHNSIRRITEVHSSPITSTFIHRGENDNRPRCSHIIQHLP